MSVKSFKKKYLKRSGLGSTIGVKVETYYSNETLSYWAKFDHDERRIFYGILRDLRMGVLDKIDKALIELEKEED